MQTKFFSGFVVVGFALVGCGTVPLLSRTPEAHNPVPKPDWQQEQSAETPRQQKDSAKEKPRTPSVVWLPESQKRVSPPQHERYNVSSGTGYDVTTSFDDCVRVGYSLLDGVDCASREKIGEELLSQEALQKPSAEIELAARSVSVPQELRGKVETPVSAPMQDGVNTVRPASQEAIAHESEPLSTFADDRLPTSITLVRTERVVFLSDRFFARGKSGIVKLTSGGKTDLLAIISRVSTQKQSALRKIVITSHTDRLGSTSRNFTTADRHAAVVKAFLIREGIDPDRLQTAGVGAGVPVKQCAEGRSRAQLKRCLGPNRRVELELFQAV